MRVRIVWGRDRPVLGLGRSWLGGRLVNIRVYTRMKQIILYTNISQGCRKLLKVFFFGGGGAKLGGGGGQVWGGGAKVWANWG